MTLPTTFDAAIRILAHGADTHEELSEARHIVARAVRSLVTTPVQYEDSFADWIANGDFSGNETAEGIAAEWDAQYD